MAVETVNFISDLNITKPDGSEPKNEGDDHLRNIKKGIKATFPNLNGAVNATPAQINLLVGKTDVATAQDIANAQLSSTLPGLNDPAKAGTYLRNDGTWSSIDLRGSPVINKGSVGTTAQIINYAQGEGQTITATGSHDISVTGFPTSRLAGVLLRMNGYGNFPPTTTGITWIKSDGTFTTNFPTSGIVLSTGLSIVSLFSYGDGTVYAKVMR